MASSFLLIYLTRPAIPSYLYSLAEATFLQRRPHHAKGPPPTSSDGEVPGPLPFLGRPFVLSGMPSSGSEADRSASSRASLGETSQYPPSQPFSMRFSSQLIVRPFSVKLVSAPESRPVPPLMRRAYFGCAAQLLDISALAL
ncbi:uncharacterized protein UHOD_11246 [Ustilago sp. UG-2017b]|nr:uncharacterized protein UHOD_11246 [Ustilago sp. UG-2017b]